MARTATLAAGVLSLILVGTWGKAQAGETVTSANTSQGVISLFGKTFCSSQAPPETKCDWRVPEVGRPKPATTAYAFTLFGTRYCIGQNPSGHCDFQFPPKATTSEPESKVFRLFGMNFCVGDVSASSRCDLRFSVTPSDNDRRARL